MIAQRLWDEHGLDITLCAEALDILEAAIHGMTQRAPPVQHSPPTPHITMPDPAPTTAIPEKHAVQTAVESRRGAHGAVAFFFVALTVIIVYFAAGNLKNEAALSSVSTQNIAETAFNQGLIYYNNKEYDQAIASFDEVLNIDPNYAPALAYRGGSYRYRKNYDTAIVDCTAALQIDPQNAISFFHRGSAYYLKGDTNRGIADLTEAIRLDPNNADAWNNRGGAYRNKGDYNRSIADYTEALRLAPNDTVIKTNLADVQNRQERAQIASSLNIASMKAGNWRGEWITMPGDTLYASAVYHVRIMVNYKASISDNVLLNVKWYYPGNELRRWEDDAPSGYTYSINRSISTAGGEFDLGSWGWDVPGNFPRGTHKIELWYKDVLLNTVNVELR
jgi:tetratricopeptide (TPR) repeat protein